MLERRRLALVGILVLATLLRVAVIDADDGYTPQNDAFEYDYYAQSVAAGDGYPESGYLRQGGPTAIRGPGYPYLLGAVYALSADSRDAGRLAGTVLGVLGVLLIYLIAKRVWGRRVGLIAAALAAVFPPLVLLSRELWSETLFIPLALGAVLCVLEFRRSGGGLRWAVAAGALCGFALLTRNTAGPLLICVPLGMIVSPFRFTFTKLQAPLTVLALAALVVAPWTIRNAAEFGRLVPVTTSSGITGGGAYNQASFDDAGAHGAWRTPQAVPQFAQLFETPGIDEAKVDSVLRREAREFAWQHPGYVAEVFAWNLVRMFELTGGSVVDVNGEAVTERGVGSATPPAERIGLLLTVLLAVCGLAAIVGSRRRGRDFRGGFFPAGPLFLWLIPILTLAATALVNGLPRDRLPIDPFLLMLAAIGVAWLSGLLSRQETQPG